MTLPSQIGRFKVLRELGRGSQGVVYLAQDPRLERQIAIKTLVTHFSLDSDSQNRLMHEARTVSKLQHPNIIPVYEAGEYQNKPFLVFEFVDGISLREYLEKERNLPTRKVLKMMQQILDGVAYAHQQGVIHRDLKPGNILINKTEVPRIMDFGIAVMTGNKKSEDQKMAGTPCYMSPEHFVNKPIGPVSDVFSLGLIFYEMLTGRQVIKAENHFAAMYQISNLAVERPSVEHQVGDSLLDNIILKALAKEPEQRYPDGQAMRLALADYQVEKENIEIPEVVKTDGHATLDFLLRRMRLKSDFPTFSQYVVEINKQTSLGRMNHISASQLANTIVKDYALTNKLLRLVNSAFYGQFAGKVCTVSRAVMVLGFEQVRLATTSLLLFEHLQNKSQSAELKDSAVGSFMSGLIAKKLAEDMRLSVTEEAFICSMLHKLGKHLVIFYFPEEYQQIQNHIIQNGVSEEAASRAVLGITFNDLGVGVAKIWRFPEKISQTMQRLPAGKADKSKSEAEMLLNLSNFSNDLCQVLVNTEGEDRNKALAAILSRFESSFPLTLKQVSKLLDYAMEKVEKYAEVLKVNFKKSKTLSQLTTQAKKLREETIVPGLDPVVDSPGPSAGETPSSPYRNLSLEEDVQAAEESKDSLTILINGIQEITNTLLENFELNQVLTMILETMYRGFGFNRVFFCLLNINRTRMQARFGFGRDMEKILQDFRFPVGALADIFNVSMNERQPMGIDNVRDPQTAKLIPEWYRRIITAPALIVFPIVVDKQVIGLIYADREQPGKVLSGDQFKYMKTLCNQIAMALRQRK